MKEAPRKLPDGSVDVKSYLTEEGRDEIPMGIDADGGERTLTPYIDINGVQVHPDRLEEFLRQIEESEKKSNHH